MKLRLESWRTNSWLLALLAILIVGGGGWLVSLDAISLHVVTLKGSALGIEETAGQQGRFVKAFDKSGEWVALGASGGRVEIWDAKKALKLGELPAPKGSYRAQNLTALELIDEKTLAGAYTDGVTAIWNLERRDLRGILRDFSGSRRYVSLGHQTNILVVNSDLGISVWQLPTKKLLWMLKFSSGSGGLYLSGNSFIGIYDKSQVIRRDVYTGRIILSDQVFDNAMSFANGTRLLVSLENRVGFEVWQKSPRKRLAIFAPLGGVQTYERDGEQRLYALTEARRALQIIDLPTLRPLARLDFEQPVKEFKFVKTPNGQHMVTIDDLHALDLWNLDSGVRLGRLDVLSPDWPERWWGVSSSGDGRTLEIDNSGVWGNPSRIAAYNLEQMKRVWSFDAPKLTRGQTSTMKLEGTKYLVQTRDDQVVIRDLSSGYVLAITTVRDDYPGFGISSFSSNGLLLSSEGDW